MCISCYVQLFLANHEYFAHTNVKLVFVSLNMVTSVLCSTVVYVWACHLHHTCLSLPVIQKSFGRSCLLLRWSLYLRNSIMPWILSTIWFDSEGVKSHTLFEAVCFQPMSCSSTMNRSWIQVEYFSQIWDALFEFPTLWWLSICLVLYYN